VARTSAGIDTIELGFRTLDADGYLGALAHTTDVYLAGLDLPDSATFGVMLNAKELVGFGAGPVRLSIAFSPQQAIRPYHSCVSRQPRARLRV
jgi:4-hydroxy 2-oxovalerate aldolase